MITIFFSYSHKDEALRNEMQSHLSMLKRQGFIETWHDRRIPAGDEVDREISLKLEESDIILLLVSSDFISSNYCWGVEIKRAMERHEAKEAVVIPVILRPCDWHDAPFGKLLATPTDGKPVTRWTDRDEAFLDITRMIKDVVKRPSKFGKATPFQDISSNSTIEAPRVPRARSSNLAVAKVFSDADRDRILSELFEYVANYFEASIETLNKRNEEIEARVRRIDANRFTATAYRNGKKTTACTIWTGGDSFSEGVNYSSDDTGGTKTMNHSLGINYVNNNAYVQVKLGGMGRNQKETLTMEGAAEYLWEQFIEPLQRPI